jgi:hypothetical protein
LYVKHFSVTLNTVQNGETVVSCRNVSVQWYFVSIADFCVKEQHVLLVAFFINTSGFAVVIIYEQF